MSPLDIQRLLGGPTDIGLRALLGIHGEHRVGQIELLIEGMQVRNQVRVVMASIKAIVSPEPSPWTVPEDVGNVIASRPYAWVNSAGVKAESKQRSSS